MWKENQKEGRGLFSVPFAVAVTKYPKAFMGGKNEFGWCFHSIMMEKVGGFHSGGGAEEGR